MLVVVHLGRLSEPVGPALKPHILAVGIAGMIARHQRRVEYGKARRDIATDVVARISELDTQVGRICEVPIEPAPELNPILFWHGRHLGSEIEATQRVSVCQFLQQATMDVTPGISQCASKRWHSKAAGIAKAAGGGRQPIDLDKHQARTVEIARGQEIIAPRAEAASHDPLNPKVILRTIVRAAVKLGLKFHSFKALFGDEVDDSGNRFGAVDRRGAVLENLDALHRDHGNQRREIHEAGTVIGLSGGKHLPPSV